MAGNNKVVWSEGMFLQPQHFQQHDRYLETLLEARCAVLRPFAWGVITLKLDEGQLALGRFAVESARGVLPDGTPFAIPEEVDPPTPLEVPVEAKNAEIYLGVPARRTGMVETDSSDDPENLARFGVTEFEVRDSNAESEGRAAVQTGRLRLRLLLESTDRSAYICLGAGHIVERRADSQLVLDEAYIAPCMDCQGSPRLAGYVTELTGLLRHRGAELAVRIAEPGRGGVAEVSDFLLLQLVNRYEPLFAHFDGLPGLHPEAFYRNAVQLAGELATFTTVAKRPSELPRYQHAALKETFQPVMGELRRSLSMVLVQKAIPIPLSEPKYGIQVADVADPGLLRTAEFVLAVSADVPMELMRTRFPAQVKIGPVQKIRELVNLHLTGVEIHPLPVAPRQIPYHAGYTYFELDRAGEVWREVQGAASCAIHIAGDYPGIKLELWAIRE